MPVSSFAASHRASGGYSVHDGQPQGPHWPLLARIPWDLELGHIVGKPLVYSGCELTLSYTQRRLLLFDRQVGHGLCRPATPLTRSKGYNTFYPRPDKSHPLGSPSPAYVWTESNDKPNWVGHLMANHKANPDLLVYDYAVGGDDVCTLEDQVKKRFLPSAGQQPDWAPWRSDNTLFGTLQGSRTIVNFNTDNPSVTWIGINDCA